MPLNKVVIPPPAPTKVAAAPVAKAADKAEPAVGEAGGSIKRDGEGGTATP